MTKTIHIPKRASGSHQNKLGDETLFYSSGVSDQARAVSSIFIDNPPKLSREHGSIVWSYQRPADRYLLIHVQGSHVVSEGLGRNYPYRASFEVTRADMNVIDFGLAALLAAVPHIATMPTGRVEEETEVDVKRSAPESTAAKQLRQRIQEALVTGRRLMVALEPKGSEWREDGVLECREMQTLLSAIDNIPISLRRYATFAFCVDENFTPVLDGVRLIFYRKGSNLPVSPDDLCMSWTEAIGPSAHSADLDSMVKACPLPGDKEPLLSPQEVAASYRIFAKSPAQLSEDEWELWLQLGHSLEEVNPSGWNEFKKYCGGMPATARQQFIKIVRSRSVKWELDGLDMKLYGLMGYGEDERLQLQRQAMEAFLKNGKYAFLFEDGMSEELKKQLDVKYLQQLNLRDDASIERWIEIYRQYDRLDDRVAKEFTVMLMPRVKGLKDLDAIVKFMTKYPFVPVDAYSRPRGIKTIPGLGGLKPEQRKVIDGWVDEAALQYQFTGIDQVVAALDRGSDKSIETRALAQVTVSQVVELLKQAKDKPAKCEQLWRATTHAGEEMKVVVQDAIKEILFAEQGCWNKQHLLTVDNWDDLAGYQESCPAICKRLDERIDALFNNLGDEELTGMTAHVERLYAIPADGGEPANEKMHAPLEMNTMVEKFVKTVMKRDHKKGTELQRRLGMNMGGKRQVIMGAIAGLVLGAVLSSLVFWLLPSKKSDTPPIPVPERVVRLVSAAPDSLMTILAQYAGPDACRVEVDTLSLFIDSTLLCSDATLLDINKMSLAADAREVKVGISQLNNGISFTDSIQTLSKEQSLLQLLNTYSCRVDSVMIDDLTIRLPKDSLLNSVTGMPASYYFSIINNVNKQLDELKKSELKSKIPY